MKLQSKGASKSAQFRGISQFDEFSLGITMGLIDTELFSTAWRTFTVKLSLGKVKQGIKSSSYNLFKKGDDFLSSVGHFFQAMYSFLSTGSTYFSSIFSVSDSESKDELLETSRPDWLPRFLGSPVIIEIVYIIRTVWFSHFLRLFHLL